MSQSITLANLFLHAVSRTNTSSNVLGAPASIVNLSPGSHGFSDNRTTVDLAGRTTPGIVCGQAIWEKLSVTTFFKFSEQSQLDNLLVIWQAQTTGAVLMIRDQFANAFYCKMSKPQVNATESVYNVTFDVEQMNYTEAI